MNQDNTVEINSTRLEAAREILGFKNKYQPKPGTPWAEIKAALEILDLIPPEKLDLTKRDDVAICMLQSKDGEDWKARTDRVKKANYNDYPFWWHGLITGGTSANTGTGIVMVTGERWKQNQGVNS